MIIDMNDYMPHEVQEVICVKCLKRWIAVYKEGTLLKDIECPECHNSGYVIATGQDISAMQGDER